MDFCSLIIFMFVFLYLLHFWQKGSISNWEYEPKNTKLSKIRWLPVRKKTPITHKEFELKFPKFRTSNRIFFHLKTWRHKNRNGGTFISPELHLTKFWEKSENLFGTHPSITTHPSPPITHHHPSIRHNKKIARSKKADYRPKNESQKTSLRTIRHNKAERDQIGTP